MSTSPATDYLRTPAQLRLSFESPAVTASTKRGAQGPSASLLSKRKPWWSVSDAHYLSTEPPTSASGRRYPAPTSILASPTALDTSWKARYCPMSASVTRYLFPAGPAKEGTPLMNMEVTEPGSGRLIISNPAVRVGGCSSEDAMEGASDRDHLEFSEQDIVRSSGLPS